MIAGMDRENKPKAALEDRSAFAGCCCSCSQSRSWLGWIVNKAREQREAVAALQKFGGFVHYDWEFVERAGEGSARQSALEADMGHAHSGQKAVGAGLDEAGAWR